MLDLLSSHLSAEAWFAALAVALVAGMVHGYSGFGGALLMVPTLSLFIEPVQAVAATTVSGLVGQIPVARQSMRIAEWKECRPFLLGAVVLMPIGAYVLATSETHVLRRLVGLSTLIAAGILLGGWAYRGVRNTTASALFGGLSGLINGATGQGGPMAVVYFIAAPTTTELQRANIITVIAFQIAAILVALSFAGILSLAIVVFGLALSIPFAAGMSTGNRLFTIIPRQNYKRVCAVLVMAAGLVALLR